MDQMKRFAIYYAPRDGVFADAAARWLGWDLRAGCPVAQPALPGLADQTAEPRKYGFHGTIKPPFRLADGTTPQDLAKAVARLAARLQPVEMPCLDLILLEGFLALVPLGDSALLRALASQVVQGLDPYRAPLTDVEIARRRPDRLTPRQRELLDIYGYPFVMEEFQFHLTLSGRLSEGQSVNLTRAAQHHFAEFIAEPFRLEDLCLCGEDQSGRFHLLDRYALST